MKLLPAALLLLCFATASTAELTRDQKISDLTQLAIIYDKNYGPYEWKRDALGFDLLNIQPWIDRAVATKNDLEFMDLLVEYVASLNDAHDSISFPSSFSARTGLSVDVYEGKVLIDTVDRLLLPSAAYPFVTGDEIISIDGKPVADLLKEFSKYGIAANPRSTARITASRLFSRSQSIMPLLANLGESAAVVVRRANGNDESYTLPWVKTGIPITQAGPVPSPKGSATAPSALSDDFYWDDAVPAHMAPMMPLLQAKITLPPNAVQGFGSTAPVFALPANFAQRLGRFSSDEFYSGTYEYDGLKIGYLRIPDYSPASASSAIRQLETEVQYLQQNTDGLVVDDMRNPGGSISYCDSVLQRLIPGIFRTIGFEIRATSTWLVSFNSAYQSAKNSGAQDWVQAFLKRNVEWMTQANSEMRGRTPALSLNATGSIDLLPADIVYSKPLIVLVDEMSASGADAFAAVMQDNKRGPIFGYRTMGAGGNIVTYDGPTYTEAAVRVTQSLMNRKNPIVTDEYPTAPYVENIGVRPDIIEDYMTRDNLMNRGATFVNAFSKAIAAHIRASQ